MFDSKLERNGTCDERLHWTHQFWLSCGLTYDYTNFINLLYLFASFLRSNYFNDMAICCSRFWSVWYILWWTISSKLNRLWCVWAIFISRFFRSFNFLNWLRMLLRKQNGLTYVSGRFWTVRFFSRKWFNQQFCPFKQLFPIFASLPVLISYFENAVLILSVFFWSFFSNLSVNSTKLVNYWKICFLRNFPIAIKKCEKNKYFLSILMSKTNYKNM